jgi:hypothetical protein
MRSSRFWGEIDGLPEANGLAPAVQIDLLKAPLSPDESE